MFNIGFAELLLILIIAYVIVGPKDLPKVARWLGRMVRYARQIVKELKAEVGWDEVMNETQDVRRDIESALKEADIRKDLTDARKTLQQSLREAEKDTMKKPEGGEAAKTAPPQTEQEREGTDIPVSFKEWESRKRKERAEKQMPAEETEQTGSPDNKGNNEKTEEKEK